MFVDDLDELEAAGPRVFIEVAWLLIFYFSLSVGTCQSFETAVDHVAKLSRQVKETDRVLGRLVIARHRVKSCYAW